MKSMLRKLLLISFASLLLACSCTLTPEDKIYSDITENLTSIDSPGNVTVTSNHLNNNFTVTWDPVENATYYTVEYQRTRDYLGGGEFNTLFVDSGRNSIVIDAIDEESRDKRYIFRVKAVHTARNSNNSIASSIESSEVEAEGAIVDYLSVNYAKQDNKLTIFTTVSNVASRITEENIVDYEVKYYDPSTIVDGVIDSNSKEIDIDDIVLTAGEDFSCTAALFVDGTVTATYSFETSGDYNYDPDPVTNITPTNNLRDSIVLNWTEVIPEQGLDVDVRYAVQKRMSGENDWQYIMDSSSEDESTLLIEGTTYTDFAIENDIDYEYRVLTVYIRQSDSAMYYQSLSTAKAVTAHAIDTKPASFTAAVDGEGTENEDGSYTVAVELNYSFRSEDIPKDIPEEFSIQIKRVDRDNADKPVVVFDGVEPSPAKDTIKLTSEEHRFSKSFYYTIDYLWSGESLTENNPTAAKREDSSDDFILDIDGTIDEIAFITNAAVTDVNSPLAKRVGLSWNVNLPEGLDKSKLQITILRNIAGESAQQQTIETLTGNDESFSDETADPGQLYEYVIRAQYNEEGSNYNGYSYSASTTNDGNVLQGMRLSVPSGIAANTTLNEEAITVTWSAVDGASGYVISYQKSGDTEVKTKSIDGGDVETSLTVDEDSITAGSVYDIWIQAKDINDNLTDKSDSVSGMILGPIEFTVSEGPDYITLNWTDVDGISYYNVYIASSVSGDGAISIQTTRDASSFTLDANEIPENVADLYDYPLSEKYYFFVLPFDVALPEDSEFKEGSWARAPKNITATKAAYRDIIQISWDAVEGISSYQVYYRDHNSDGDWEFLTYISSTNFSFITQTEEYDFSVASVINGEVGPIQNVFIEDQNYGYPLKNITRFGASDIGNGFFLITFERVKGATSYTLTVEDESINILQSEVDSAPQNIEFTEGSIALDESGLVTCCVRKIPIERKLTWDVSLFATNDNAVYQEKNTTDTASLTNIYSNVSEEEMVSLVLYLLGDIFKNINNDIFDDWWAVPAYENEYEPVPDSSVSFIRSYGSEGTLIDPGYYYPRHPGSVSINRYSSNGILLSGSFSYNAEDGDWRGASDTNRLLNITGNLNVTLPYDFPVLEIAFSSFDVNSTNISSIAITDVEVGEEENIYDFSELDTSYDYPTIL